MENTLHICPERTLITVRWGGGCGRRGGGGATKGEGEGEDERKKRLTSWSLSLRRRQKTHRERRAVVVQFRCLGCGFCCFFFVMVHEGKGNEKRCDNDEDFEKSQIECRIQKIVFFFLHQVTADEAAAVLQLVAGLLLLLVVCDRKEKKVKNSARPVASKVGTSIIVAPGFFICICIFYFF